MLERLANSPFFRLSYLQRTVENVGLLSHVYSPVETKTIPGRVTS